MYVSHPRLFYSLGLRYAFGMPFQLLFRVFFLQRDLMVRGELVRIKNGEIADPSTLRRSAQRKLGHSFAVVYLAPDSTDVSATLLRWSDTVYI